MSPAVAVRPFESAEDYARMVDYFVGADETFLHGMGIDPARMPSREAWLASALADHDRAAERKERIYLAWLRDGERVGHSSASHIEPWRTAHVHLHLWRPELRRGGLGRDLLSRSIDHYFERFGFEFLACEPSTGNPAPNRTLESLGFRLVRTFRACPTAIAFEQEINRWEIRREAWRERRGATGPEL